MIFLYLLNFTDPLKLDYTNSLYKITNIKEDVAKDSFLTLDENIRRCQEEPQDDCNTRKYLDTLRKKCQCLPFQSRFLGDKVFKIPYNKIFSKIHSFFRILSIRSFLNNL